MNEVNLETDNQMPYSPCVAAAVDWWVNAIFSKEQPEAEDNTLTEQKLAFRDTLAKGIEDGLARYSSITLEVKYRPEGILLEAAHAGHVPNCAFPSLTKMIIHQTSVEVSNKIWYET